MSPAMAGRGGGSGGGLLTVQGYGAGRFRLGGRVIVGAVIIIADTVHTWPLDQVQMFDPAGLAPVFTAAAALDILLMGCGERAAAPPPAFSQACRAAGLAFDVMGTGAACRTFNVLVGEGRRVAAALAPVD